MLQTTTNINVDFYDQKYVLVNAKQLDRNSRELSITCYNHGEPFNINAGEHAAYVRYRKADGYCVFNNCDINRFGKIIVKLTEQMLAVNGVCYADLIVVNKGDVVIDTNTGKIEEKVENASILSSMMFCINVSEDPFMNSSIESTYEFILLNDNLEKYWANFEDVIKTSKSWAVGGTGVRENEDYDNAKYYYEQSVISVSNISQSEDNALESANLAKSYAVGGTGVRENEDKDNSWYYLQQIKSIVNGVEGGFIPMGTISFAELATADKATGFMYNISDDFVTDDSFAEGAGKSYTAGTNVYCRSDGMLDCFGGASSPTATVDEVKEYLGIE